MKKAALFMTQRKSATNNLNKNFTKLNQGKLISKTFLPSDYTAPTSEGSNYMKLQDGENKIRILSQPIIGWVDWENNKPMRFPFDEKPAHAVDATKPIRHFWAFVVWNYTQEAIQILEITQSTVRTPLKYCAVMRIGASPISMTLRYLRWDRARTPFTP